MTTFILAGFLFSFLSCMWNTDNQELRSDLETSYIQFLNALKTGKEAVIKETMSSYSYASNKNDYADAKESFSIKMKEVGETYPYPSDLQFIKLFKKGPTAALLYSKDSDSSKIFHRPMLTFIFIKFVNENESWKTDVIELMDIEKYDSNGSLTTFDASFLSAATRIDGKVKAPPPLIPEAEVPGVLELFLSGIKATIYINTIKQGTIEEISELRLIHGGLRIGKNTVKIICDDDGDDIEKSIDLSIQAKKGDEFIEVFRYNASDTLQKKVESTFEVSGEIIYQTTPNK